jgi:hypothetical protein
MMFMPMTSRNDWRIVMSFTSLLVALSSICDGCESSPPGENEKVYGWKVVIASETLQSLIGVVSWL